MDSHTSFPSWAAWLKLAGVVDRPARRGMQINNSMGDGGKSCNHTYCWIARLDPVLCVDTDLPAQLAYRDRIAGFHAELRRFYYPFLFLERPFGAKEFRQLPAYRPRQPTGSISVELIGALALAVLGIVAGGLVAVRRVQPVPGETGAA